MTEQLRLRPMSPNSSRRHWRSAGETKQNEQLAKVFGPGLLDMTRLALSMADSGRAF